MYANDNRGTYPYAGLYMDDGPISWDDLLGYGHYDGRSLTWAQVKKGGLDMKVDNVGGNKVYCCPEDPDQTRMWDLIGNGYAMNRGGRYQDPGVDVWKPYGISLDGSMAPNNPAPNIKVTDVKDSSGTILLAETIFTGTANSWVDAHLGDLYNCAVDGPTHQAQPENWSWCLLPPMTPRHSGTWNYLFCDGHVERLDPKATIGNGTMDYPKGMWYRNVSWR
jgi:prepilin-type processing-associated H-X9-DG protein